MRNPLWRPHHLPDIITWRTRASTYKTGRTQTFSHDTDLSEVRVDVEQRVISLSLVLGKPPAFSLELPEFPPFCPLTFSPSSCALVWDPFPSNMSHLSLSFFLIIESSHDFFSDNTSLLFLSLSGSPLCVASSIGVSAVILSFLDFSDVLRDRERQTFFSLQTDLAAYPCGMLFSAVFILPLSQSSVFFFNWAFASVGKESACNAGDLGSIPGLRRSPGEGNRNPLQYSCLENSTDRGAWWATVRGVTKGSDTTECLNTQDRVFQTTHFYWVHVYDLPLPAL